MIVVAVLIWHNACGRCSNVHVFVRKTKWTASNGGGSAATLSNPGNFH